MRNIQHEAEVNKLTDAECGEYVRVEYDSNQSEEPITKYGLISDIRTDGNYFYGVVLSRATEDGPEVVCSITAQDMVLNGNERELGSVTTIEYEGENDD